MITELKSVPCTDCGNSFAKEVMEFDHVRGEKSFTISDSIHRVSIQKLLDEVAKCDVVCANCHRMRTFYGLDWQFTYSLLNQGAWN